MDLLQVIIIISLTQLKGPLQIFNCNRCFRSTFLVIFLMTYFSKRAHSSERTLLYLKMLVAIWLLKLYTRMM